jgi:hypothetical protein
MSPRSALMQLFIKAGIGFAALFVVGVVLAAIPNHRPPAMTQSTVDTGAIEQQPQEQGQPMDHSKMPGMSMEADDAKSSEQDAMHDMAHVHHGDNPHMHMTAPRPQTAADVERANEIVKELRAGIETYKDYHVALNEGYKIFLPNVPQPEYHFTNYTNGFLEAFTFDPARPTSLLYKKTADGYELVGAMYTMPKRASEDQLNQRVPLSVATWHLHTNLCMPPRGQRKTADYTKFGLHGSITTQEACDDAGGKFHPVVFGWMVHVYPYEDSTDKIFAMHHKD